MFKLIINKIKNILSKRNPKTHSELFIMTKEELECYGRILGVELDRRKKHSTLVSEIIKAQYARTK